MRLAYYCLSCGCIHGWIKDELVTPVERHIRYPGEDVWYCPRCGKEHRTFDGTFMGQMSKHWTEIDLDEPEKWPFEHGRQAYKDRDGNLVIMEWDEDRPEIRFIRVIKRRPTVKAKRA